MGCCSFIEDAIKDVGSKIEDEIIEPIKDVGSKIDDKIINPVVDIVEDAADWIVDEIVEPVLRGVDDIVKAALDDPIATIAKVVAVASGNAWALPLIDGAVVAADGGDLGDVVKAAAISYATGKVAGVTAKYVNPTIAKAGFNDTVELALQKGIEGGARSATTAVVYGQDPLKAFATGGLNAAVGATLGQIANKVDTKFDNYTGGIDVEGTPIVGGWEKLQDGVKDSITAAITAELTGGEVSAAQLTGIIGKYSGVSETMSKFLSENTGMPDATAQVMTTALTNAASVALAGNPELSSEAFFAKWDDYGMEALKKLVDKPVNAAIDKISGRSKKTENAANALNFALGKATDASSEYNRVRGIVNTRVGKLEGLEATYNKALKAFNKNPTDATQNAANKASKAYNDYANDFQKDYKDRYKPKLDAAMKTYDKYNPQIKTLSKAYDKQTQYLMTDIDTLDKSMKPVLEGANKEIALKLRPGIDEDKYRELNGLKAGEDVYTHYLANQGTAEVFGVSDLNDELKEYLETLKIDTSNPSEMYGKSYETRTETETGTNVNTGEPYEREVTRFYLRTPDGAVEVDPYLEGGGRGGDPRDFNDGVWTMKDYRTENLSAVSLGSRVTSDMASVIGDSSKQGQLITLNDFKKLKDAGYKVNSFRDKYTGELINGDKSYDDILANYVKEGRSEVAKYFDKNAVNIDFEGYTKITPQIYADVVKFFREEQGLSKKEAEIQADKIAPVGGLLLGSYVQEKAGMDINTALQEYMRNAEVTIAGEASQKYAVGEEPEKILIAEAARLVGDENYNAFLQNTAGLGLDAIGQLAQTMSYATILSNAAGLTDTKAEETWLNSFGKILSKAGEGLKTEDYQAQITKMNEDMAKAMADTEGVGGTLKAILGVAWENPTAFVSEYVVSEIFQELPLLLASGGTSLLIKGGLKVGAKAVGKEFAETSLKRIGVGAALATSVVTNVAEGYGGAAQDGYEKGLNTYNSVEFKNLIAKGLSASEARAVLETPAHIEKAETYALELAEQAGAIGGAMAILTAGAGAAFGMPDSIALEKALFKGKEAPTGFANYVKDLAKTMTAEGVAEGVEETAISGFIEGRLALIDPSRDVSGNTTMAAFLGFIGGSNTAGGISVGNDIITAGSGMSTEARNIIATAPPNVLTSIGIGSFTGPTMAGDSGIEDVLTKPSAEVVMEELDKLGISADAKFDLANVVHNDQFTTKAEVREYVELNNPNFDFTGDNATNAYDKFVGNKADSNLAVEVAAYIDPLYTTYAEAIAAARAEGVTLTEEQVEEYVGRPEDDVEGDINAEYDAEYTSKEEAIAGFERQNGYTPTDKEINKFVGANPDSELDTLLGTYVNPRQVTDKEARKFFDDLGYEPTDKEVKNYIGQGNKNFESNKKGATALYVDPRQVTDKEARKFFDDLGYEPTDAEVADFVAQVQESEQQTAIDQYVDPRFVTQDELQAIADAEGFTLTETLAATYLGQKDQESTLAAATAEFDPLATTTSEAKAFFKAQGFTPTDQQVADFVASKTEKEQKAAIATFVDPRQVTTDEAKALFDALGYTSTDAEVADFVGQGGADFASTAETNVGAYVDPRQVTDAEARQFFADLGYTPTDKQVAQFVAQVEETTQSGLIADYVDPRQVTRAEVQAIADEEGLTLTDVLAATYVGQGEAKNFASDTLDAARTEYDPLATTLEEATQFFADTGYTADTDELAQFVASKTEEVQTSAIGAYVDPRQMTSDEAREFLSAIGYNPTDQEVADFTGQLNDENYQVTQKTAIDEYVDPRFFDTGEVRAAYEELGLVDVTQEDVDRFVGQYDETSKLEELRAYMPTATFNVIKSIMGSPSVEDDPNTEADESKDATGIYAELEAGATRDEALQAAIDKLATDMGTTKEDLLSEIGLTEERLRDEIGVVIDDVADVKEDVADVKEDVGGLADILGTAGVKDDPNTEEDETQDPTGLFATIKAYEDAGLDRDEALQKAIDDVASALGTTKTDLLTAIGETESSLTGIIGDVETGLTETIGDVEDRLGADIDAVADLVGKPARDVTQEDIDFVIDLIAQENVSEELITQYDVTGDGIVDINDQTMLETALQGEEDVTLADTSMFNPATGLYLEQEQNTDTVTDMITDMNTQINTQMNQQNFAEFQKLLAESNDVGGQRVDVKSGDKVKLDYMYDIGGDSIFATSQQEGMFGSPFGQRATMQPANQPLRPLSRASGFAQGGQVEDENDMLLRILGET